MMLLFSLAIISTLGIYTMLPLYLIAEHRYIIFLQPLIAVCFYPAGFAALSLIVPAELRNIAISFTLPLAFCIGGGLAPVFFGIIGDISSLALGIGISGGLIAAGAMFTGSLKFHDQVN